MSAENTKQSTVAENTEPISGNDDEAWKNPSQEHSDAQDFVNLFRILDQMMPLPDHLERVFRDEIMQFEEENQMPYISSIERIARQEGFQQGQRSERQSIVRNLFSNRFGVIDETLETILAPIVALSAVDFTNFLLSFPNVTREELLARFSSDTLH